MSQTGVLSRAVSVDGTDFDAAIAHMLRLHVPVAEFFDALMVDDPDPAVKARRMGLLLEVAAVFRLMADFTRISTR